MGKFNLRSNRLETNRLYGQNLSGADMMPGTPVYIVGNQNGILQFGAADSSDPSKMPCIGVTSTVLRAGNDGDIIIGGYAEVTVSGLAGVSVGDSLYVAAGGGLSLTPGSDPQVISSVLEVSVPGVISEFLVAFGGAGAGGAETLKNLTDTPSGYGSAGNILISDGISSFTYSPYTFPNSDGTTDQYLQTDGAGNLSFSTISAALEGLTDTPSGYGTAGQVLITNGVDGFTFGSNSPWEEVAGTSTKITYEQGTVGIKAAASVYPGHSTISGFLGGTFPSDSGSRGPGTLLHLHEGKLTVSTAFNTATSMFELVNPQHSAAAGGAIGLSGYNLRIHGYHAIEFNHGSSFGTSSGIVYMDHPASSANVGTIEVGRVDSSLGGINLPSFGAGTVDTTNYSISMGGRIIFKNHSNISWDAITQGPGTYHSAGVSLSSFYSHDILVAVSSDSNTSGSYGYVGINSYSPSATGPAFEVSSSYAKFNSGLHIGDITTTGYAFPTATGTLDQVLKVDANGDLIFGADNAGLWTADTNGITYTAGNVGIGAASSSNFDLNVGSGIILEAGQLLFSSVSDGIRLQSAFNTTAGVGIGYQAISSGGAGSVSIGNQVRSPDSGTVVIGYSSQAMTGYTAANPRAVHIGHSAGMTATTATDTIAIGNGPLSSLTTGAGNLALGRTAGSSITTESYNTFIGYEAGRTSTGGDNVFLGKEAGELTTTGSRNVYVGKGSGVGFTTENNNTVVGIDSGGSGIGNVVIGGLNKVVGNTNVIVGYQTDLQASGATVSGFHTIVGSLIRLNASSTFTDTTIVGTNAGEYGSVIRSVLVGHQAGKSTTSQDSVLIGYQVNGTGGGATNSVFVGHKVNYGGTASASTIIGAYAGYHSEGTSNTYIGQSAGMSYDQNSGVAQTGGSNVAIGASAGYHLTTSSNNVLVGASAGYELTTGGDNVLIGTGNAPNLTTQSNNVIIGHDAVTGASWNFGNSVVIGYQAGKNVSGATGQGLGVFIGENSGNWSTAYYGNNVNIGKNSGNSSVAIGEDAGATGGGGLYGTIIGRQASGSGTVIGANAVGGGKVAVGEAASAAASNAIAIGGTANYTSAVSIGGTVNGQFGIAIGQTSAEATSVSIGYTLVPSSSNTIQIGTYNGAWTVNQTSTGNPSENIILGNNIVLHSAAANANAITDYASNVFVGSNIASHPAGSLSKNVVIGQEAYNGPNTYVDAGDNNVIIGYGAGKSLGANVGGSNIRPISGNVLIGNEVGQDQAISNRLYIDNSNTTTPLVYGEFDNNIVKINGTYSGGVIGFFPANSNNDTIAIGDQDYLAAGGATSFKGLSILFDSTISAVDYQSGLIIGRHLNIPLLKNDQLIIGNRVTAATVNQAPKIIIGNGIDYDAGNNNHAGGILIGANPACEMGNGVQIGGDGTNFNGVAIKATGAASSQGGVAIMGEAKAYSVMIGASTYAGVNGGGSQKVVIGNGAGASSGIGVAIGAGAGSNKTGSYNTAIGLDTYSVNTSTGTGNTIIGQNAGRVLTSASNNTMIGARAALSLTSGSNNVVIGGGLGAGGGAPMQAMTTGAQGNIVLGANALVTATSASYNIIAGLDGGVNVGGSSNLILGRRTAFAGTTNNTAITNNVVLGYQAGYNLASTGNVMLGYEAGYNETGGNKLYISNSNTTDPLIYGEFDNDLLRVNGNFQRVVFGGTETTTSGTIHIRDNTNWATQADATNNTASTGLLGVAQGAQANVGLVLFGDVDYTITGNVGTPVYLNTTAGGLTTTAPTGSGNIVRVMGYIIGTNKVFFNPSNDWIQIA